MGSVNPGIGVSVVVSPNDRNGAGAGTTAFTRVYDHGSVVNLTAPAAAGGNPFLKWQRDGVDFGATPGISVTMDGEHTLTAMYGAESAETAYVTGKVLGTLRNNYTGYVGMKVAVGASPVTVTALGRIFASGNSGTHVVKLINAADGSEVAGGSVSVAMSGGRSSRCRCFPRRSQTSRCRPRRCRRDCC